MFKFFRKRYRVIKIDGDLFPFKIQVNTGLSSFWLWEYVDCFYEEVDALKEFQTLIIPCIKPTITVIAEFTV